MKFLILSFLMLLSSPVLSKEYNCFSKHISEAISKNKERRDLYAKMTNGESKSLSNLLINAERASFVVAKIYDWRVKYFQRNGLPLLCLDYIDMDLTPNFSAVLDYPNLKYDEIRNIDISKVRKKLKKSLKVGYLELEEELEHLIDVNRNTGHYNCMFVHVLESIRRSAHLATHYIDSAREKGLRSPKKIIDKNIKLQINSLGIWYSLDKKASKFQEQGVQILCRDVPKIELPTSLEIDSIYR
ncbi:hypothetical protein BIY24_02950 [Halobacteriovorax marinus]|uniref:hypothetical protein n=1 Tax=Halobacteriovorax marinus TaxID=97084 RepID=UPI000BC2C9A0|nr:hypothetical protein [Halobacteriovorax marinus]ATH06929.1 hypothetical protein BIY24_02950 [Halobacteriovorax marinus]